MNTKNIFGFQLSPLSTQIILFLSMRLTILFLFSPQGLFNAYTDYAFYYRSAQFSDQGYYPFINMWYEYPPLAAYLPILAYKLTQLLVPMGDVFSFSFQIFMRVLGVILLMFETGNLMLIYFITTKVWDQTRAEWVGWVYSGLSLPLFFWLFSHHVITVFFLLLAIYWFTHQKMNGSAIALGLGIVSKILPIFLFAPVVRFLWPHWRKIVIYGIVVSICVGVFYLPFILAGGTDWVVASFEALFGVGSYGTLWAVWDGNWGPGSYGDVITRTQLEEAGVHQANPSAIPFWVTLGIFGFVYAILFFRPLDKQDPKQFIWFTTLTMLIFLLWSKGWSPQWAVMVVPLLLISFPDHFGMILSLILSFVIFLEWPLAGVFDSKFLLVMSILGRLSVFLVVFWVLIKRIWPSGKQMLEIQMRV